MMTSRIRCGTLTERRVTSQASCAVAENRYGMTEVSTESSTIVVPERPVLGSNRLKNVLSVAQIASSAALVAAVAIP